MEVSSSFERIEKFSGRPGTISLTKFKATYLIMVCELELKYGANYIEAFAFKQLAHYVHYKALDVYKQHSPMILGVAQIKLMCIGGQKALSEGRKCVGEVGVG
jgi:hypothetical protein